MNQLEKQFWGTIQPMMFGHVQRIENTAGVGVPDVNICYKGREYWIELKVCQPEILVRVEQWAWHNRRMANGGKCFLLAYSYEEETAYFAPTFLLKVKAYGTQRRYVQVTNKEALIHIKKSNLREFLKTNLFT